MLGSRHEIARLQSIFYRDQYYKMLRWLMVSMAVIFLLIAAIIYIILVQPSIDYYANTTSGRIMEMPRENS